MLQEETPLEPLNQNVVVSDFSKTAATEESNQHKPVVTNTPVKDIKYGRPLLPLIFGAALMIIGIFITDTSEGLGGIGAVPFFVLGFPLSAIGFLAGITSKDSRIKKTVLFITIALVLGLVTFGILNATVYDESTRGHCANSFDRCGVSSN